MRLYAGLWRIFRRTHRPCPRPWSKRIAAFDGRKTHICSEKWSLTGDKQGWGTRMTINIKQHKKLCNFYFNCCTLCSPWSSVFAVHWFGLALYSYAFYYSSSVMLNLNHNAHIHKSNFVELFFNLIFVLSFQLHQVLRYLRQGLAGSTEATDQNWGDKKRRIQCEGHKSEDCIM